MVGDTCPPSAGSFPPAWVRCRAAAPCPRSSRTRWCSPGWSSQWPWPGPRPACDQGSIFRKDLWMSCSKQTKKYLWSAKYSALPHNVFPVIRHRVAEIHEVVKVHRVVLGLGHTEPGLELWWIDKIMWITDCICIYFHLIVSVAPTLSRSFMYWGEIYKRMLYTLEGNIHSLL